MRFKLSKIVISIFIVVFSIYLNLLINQYRFFKKGEYFEKKNKNITAIDYYSYVILCYTPFSSYINKAKDKILNFGKYFEKKGELYKTLFAYEILRSSYFQVRNFYQPEEKLIQQLNKKIVNIKVKILKEEKRLKNYSDELKRQLTILKTNDFPSTINSFIMCMAFIIWIGSIFYLIWYLNKNYYIIILAIASFILWISSII